MLADLRAMIESARGRVAVAVNSGLVMLNWNIGARIRREVLKDERAAYGQKIVATVSQQLAASYGPGYSLTALTRMVRFSELFADPAVVSTLMQQLTWSHFVLLIPIKDEFAREYYAEMCRIERWSVRTLRAKIDGLLFERTALAKKPEKLAREEIRALRKGDVMTPDMVFQDPLILEFLNLKSGSKESELEDAILEQMEKFLLELGVGFSFIGRQKRIQVGAEDFYLDLLFYNRRMRRLVAIELKQGKFRPEYKGEMVELDRGDMRVAEFKTIGVPKELLRSKLNEAIGTAREKFAGPAGGD